MWPAQYRVNELEPIYGKVVRKVIVNDKQNNIHSVNIVNYGPWFGYYGKQNTFTNCKLLIKFKLENKCEYFYYYCNTEQKSFITLNCSSTYSFFDKEDDKWNEYSNKILSTYLKHIKQNFVVIMETSKAKYTFEKKLLENIEDFILQTAARECITNLTTKKKYNSPEYFNLLIQ